MLTVPLSLHSAYLHLLTDLDEFGHLVLQLAVPLHQVGQVVLQGLLLGKEKNKNESTRMLINGNRQGV